MTYQVVQIASALVGSYLNAKDALRVYPENITATYYGTAGSVLLIIG